MTESSLRFGPFSLDRAARQLRRGTALIDLNARYFDALCLLASAPGELITKDRFMTEVWRGIPVTDEALTQCIRTLRRVLEDDAVRPRYIATVPKYGYRFVAPTDAANGPSAAVGIVPAVPSYNLIASGTLGGLLAGTIGGAVYGFAAAPIDGGLSVLAVLIAITATIAALGAAGVSLGMTLALRHMPGNGAATALGAALGGLAIGAVTELVGKDALMLLLGNAPTHMTGAGEGLLLGGAVGTALWWTRGRRTAARVAGGSAVGAAAGLVITLSGGRLFAGSLAALTERFGASRLDMGRIGTLVGDPAFGAVGLTVTAMLEGALFAAAICWAAKLRKADQPYRPRDRK